MTDTRPKEGMTVELKVGESIVFQPSVDSEKIVLTIEPKSGQRARLRIQATETVKVSRPSRRPG